MASKRSKVDACAAPADFGVAALWTRRACVMLTRRLIGLFLLRTRPCIEFMYLGMRKTLKMEE
jgi:hypothetical protein